MQQSSFIYITSIFVFTIILATGSSYFLTTHLVEKKMSEITTENTDSPSVNTQPTPLATPEVDWEQQEQNFNLAIESDPELAATHQELFDRRTSLYEQFELYDDSDDIPESLLLEYEEISDAMLELLINTP